MIYDHPKYERHSTRLLEGLTLPYREVDDYEIYHVNRRFFNGENAVRMLERTLGIEGGASAVYNRGGYVNNLGSYQGARQGQSVEEQVRLGKRRQREYEERGEETGDRKRVERNYGNNAGGY